MSSKVILPHLTQVATFLNVKVGKISLNEEKIPVRTSNNTAAKGFINIILSLLNESKDKKLGGAKDLEQNEIRQWFEYAIVYAVHCNSQANISQVLSELNGVLAVRTYLVSHKLTLADIVLFYVLSDVMQKLSQAEKEKYINVSRWYDNLQQNSSIRQSNAMVNFNTNYLASCAPARH